MAGRKDDAAATVQKAVDAAEERGFLGVEVDPTPNENYTVAGVTAGKPTPETDAEARSTARSRIEELAQEPSAK